MTADLLIIGAGTAGLMAAHAVRAHGFPVTLLEARARIGGRVWTDRTISGAAGHPVEFGAEFIHGDLVPT